MITANTWKNGFTNGLKTSFLLLKVIIPVFALIKILEHTPVIGWISQFCDPLMHFVGLPGKAALAVVTGMFLNSYAATGIIFALGLTAWQVTIIAVILSCWWVLISCRFVLAAFAAFAISFVVPAGTVEIKTNRQTAEFNPKNYKINGQKEPK